MCNAYHKTQTFLFCFNDNVNDNDNDNTNYNVLGHIWSRKQLLGFLRASIVPVRPFKGVRMK